MRNRLSTVKAIVTPIMGISLLAVLSFAAQPAAAQGGPEAAARLKAAMDKPTPMTPDGHPDLNGFWNNPAGPNGTEKFERASDGSILFDFSTAFNDNKTCVGLDPACQAKNQPPYNEKAMAKAVQIAKTMNAGTTPLDPQADCRPLGIPRSGGPMQIVQSPNMIAIVYEGAPSTVARLIYMNSDHPKDLDTTFMGDSRGHWDGNTLVVDVTGLNDETWLGGDVPGHVKLTTIHSDKEHVVERWTRQGNVLTYEATVEDPEMFTKPWVINPRRVQVASADDMLLETVCTPNDKSHIVAPTEGDTGCNYRCGGATK